MDEKRCYCRKLFRDYVCCSDKGVTYTKWNERRQGCSYFRRGPMRGKNRSNDCTYRAKYGVPVCSNKRAKAEADDIFREQQLLNILEDI